MMANKKIDIHAVLGDSSFFAKVGENLLSKLIKIVEIGSYEKGELIFPEDAPCEGMYIVAEGAVKIFKISADGKEHVLHVAEYGETFGEAAIFMENSSYPAFAAAIKNTTVLMIPKREFLAILEDDPKFTIQVLESLASWTHRLIIKLEYITLKDASSRIAGYIIQRANDSGKNEFDLSVPKQTLASQLAITSETLSRILTHFEAAKIIESNGRHIVITDRAALEEISQEGGSAVY